MSRSSRSNFINKYQKCYAPISTVATKTVLVGTSERVSLWFDVYNKDINLINSINSDAL